MKDDQSSDTAMGAAVIRTAHQLLDDKPLILEDPISPLLLGDEGVREILDNPEKHSMAPAMGLRSHVVLRSRYTEDELCLASQSGITQFINLGAGYDTFAFRQPDWAFDLKIVEMDHPATQSAKRDAIEKIGVQTSPPRTSGAASRAAAQGEPWLARLDVDDLKERLIISGFRVATFLDPAQANEMYYKGRHDLPAPRKTRLCQAIVSGDLEPHRLWRWSCPDGFAVRRIANKIAEWRNGKSRRMWSTSAATT